ncbi:hypothetical protein [Kitasatospora sp. MAP5-34]|uniref:hypothetical protein n=1 Tax=Kitasatospora sp. MAP5-34 TaxID=3035102 RepID=UPI00247586F7|nr:hypothetical protein [Kitasatospora sp. MAP5-34]MDH6578125.1 hypothetical protein [Kitasatospora sp. MAP5-34]
MAVPHQQAPQQPYPPQPGQGYGYGHPQQPHPAPPNSYATASVVLGFLAVLFSCVYGGFLGLIGLGVGIAGLNRSAATGVGRNASIGGVALNTLALLITIAMVVLLATVSK